MSTARRPCRSGLRIRFENRTSSGMIYGTCGHRSFVSWRMLSSPCRNRLCPSITRICQRDILLCISRDQGEEVVRTVRGVGLIMVFHGHRYLFEPMWAPVPSDQHLLQYCTPERVGFRDWSRGQRQLWHRTRRLARFSQ
jgi:hypothetical protein